jgi:hypothetical protein
VPLPSYLLNETTKVVGIETPDIYTVTYQDIRLSYPSKLVLLFQLEGGKARNLSAPPRTGALNAYEVCCIFVYGRLFQSETYKGLYLYCARWITEYTCSKPAKYSYVGFAKTANTLYDCLKISLKFD